MEPNLSVRKNMSEVNGNSFKEGPKENINPPVEKIDVEELIKDFKILNVNNFSAYLKELWKDLTDRSDNKKLGVNKITFSKFYVLPGIIFERLFNVFDKNQNEYLDVYEFLDGMMTLFSENYEKLTKLIFNFYDFDKDGYISKEDVRVVLSYIPLNGGDSIKTKYKLKLEKEDFKDRVESQDELHLLLDKCFRQSEILDYATFLNIIENVSSEIFLYILIFLLEKRPFSKKTLEEYEGQKKYNNLFKVTKTPNPNNMTNLKKRFMVASPNLNSKFSPSVTIRKSPFWHTRILNPSGTDSKRSELLNKLGLGNTNAVDSRNILMKYSKPQSNAQSGNIDDSMKTEDLMTQDNSMNGKSLSALSTNNGGENDQMMVDENVAIKNIPIFRKHRNNLKNLETSDAGSSAYKTYNNLQILPAVKFSSNVQGNNILLTNSLRNQEKNNIGKMKFTFTSIEDDSDEEEEEEVHFEGYLYKISRGKKLKKRYFKLIHKDLYHYRNKTDPYHKGLHNLSGVFIQENQPLQFNEYFFFSFSMVFNNKTRMYYWDNKEEYENWLKSIKKATGYFNLNDSYEIKEKLGNGKFGLVRLGVHKETGRKVAIKIMYKGDMTIADMELVKTEIEILKVCQHPYIIRIYDVYENADYIYIVMEYCPGGDLFSYIEQRNFKLPENKVASLIHKLSTAVFYLHSYGVAHRDLKPENILMTDKNDDSVIRLVDFGLSKIIGPNETCTEPFGTLSYVAPEVLLELPYNKSVDMWSLGVITYLLLTGCLPFDDEHSEREVARKTINDPVPFPNYFWKNISLEARDFVTQLLQKDPSRRMTIKQVLEHSWIQKYNKTLLPEIRKKCKDLLYSTFKLYSTTDDYGK